MSEDDSDPSDPAEELAALRQSVVLRAMRAIDAAALRAQQMAEGEADSGDGRDIHPLDLLRMLPVMLRLTEPKPSPVSYDNWEYPKIPVCKICGEGPGAHWPADCPKNPDPLAGIGGRTE
jgi:hypothetical protein